MLLSLGLLITSLVGINCQSSSYYCGNTSIYYGTSGMIYSPNYPSYYRGSANCTYTWYVPTLSSVSLTIQYIDTEYSSSNCGYDWVELSCRSHSVALPSRYCGRGSNLNPVTFTPCSQVVIRFKSDGSVTGGGYAINYRADPIECADNCTLLTNSYGYVCSCDSNGTNVAMPTMAPNPQCVGGCSLLSVYSSLLCNCPVSGSLYTTSRCPPSCSFSYDYYGNPSCNCNQYTTTPMSCRSGCYRTTDWRGYPYCNCPSFTSSPISCPYGCNIDADYWGNQFCNCPRSTQPPIWCSSGCVSDTNIYGDRYCRCPTTTLPPCFSPCYYTWDYTYDYSGRRICYCPTTTTSPPPTGCNQTLTASYGTVTSPNYPNAYPRGIDCYQYIAVPMATTITIRVLEMNVYYSSSYSCYYDYVEITGCDGSLTQFCVSNTIPASGLVLQCTDESLVTIRFHSYYYYYSSYRGFKLSYSAGFASNCSDSGYYLTQGSTGVIASPNYPNNFPGYSECFNYLFTDDESIKIKITFDQLRLEDSTTCTNVFIMLTCQDDSEYTKTVCGSRIPGPMTFDCRTLQIWFRSNATTSLNPRNYKLRYYAVSRNPSTTPPPQPTLAPGHGSGETDLPQSSKIGIGLGVGVGGFCLIILIVIIIILVVNGQRQAARRDQRHLEDLTIICRNMNAGRGSVESDSVRFWRAPDARHSRPTEEGFINPMAEAARQLPSHSTGGYTGEESQSIGGGFMADQADEQLLMA